MKKEHEHNFKQVGTLVNWSGWYQYPYYVLFICTSCGKEKKIYL